MAKAEAATASAPAKTEEPAVYTIEVEGRSYVVKVSEGGDIQHFHEVANQAASAPATPVSAPVAAPAANAEPVTAPLAGNIWKVLVKAGQNIQEGDVVVILEAMKMETEIRAARAGVVSAVQVKEGDAVAVGDCMLTLA